MPLEVRSLSHVYRRGEPDEARALLDVNLTMNEGEFVLMSGRNGSGKSTLLQCMSGLAKPMSGVVTIDGRDAAQARDRVGLGVQFPERALFERTLYDDVAFGLKEQGMGGAQIRERVIEALDIVGLEKSLLPSSPQTLSHGQKRLAAIAGIIVSRPKYLFLDEPTAGLDASGKDRIVKALTGLNTDGTTIVVASHDLGHFLGACSRIIILNEGHVIVDCEPRDLISTECLEMTGIKLPHDLVIARELWRRGVLVSDLSPENIAEGIGRICGHENHG